MITRNLKQTITHWISTEDGFGGYTFGAPEHIIGRWEDDARLFRDATGEEVISNAIVYLSVDVSVTDYLFLGTSEEVDPTVLSNAYRVRQFHKIPSIRASNFERVAYL